MVTATASRCLESLPTEIIQKIHIHALEPNLPRASPRIALAVSQPFFYDVFLVHAFWIDPHGSPSSERGPHSCRLPNWYHPLSGHEQRRLQAQVMTCRWFSPGRMQEAVRMLYDWTARSLTCRSVSFSSPDRWRPSPPDPRAETTARSDVAANRQGRQIPVIQICAVPAKLLRGPWEEDRIPMLQALCEEIRRLLHWMPSRSATERAHFDWPALDQQACLQAMNDAIIGNNQDQFLCLLDILTLVQRPNNRIVLPSYLYRSAILYHPEELTFLWPLVQTSAASLPGAEEFRAWAMAARGRGDPKGLWLLEIMELNTLRTQTSSSFCLRILNRIVEKVAGLADRRPR